MIPLMLSGMVLFAILFFHCEQPPVYGEDRVTQEERQALLIQSEWDVV